MGLNTNIVGSWCVPGQTQTAGTAIVQGIPPFPGASGLKIYTVDTGRTYGQANLTGFPNWVTEQDCYIKVTDLLHANGSTSHNAYFMRPKNWTYVSSAAAINQAVINIATDPGIYSTNYRYPSPQATGAVSDHGIATNDYVAYQLVDGTWIFDKVSSVSSLAITMTNNIPNITGGGVAKNAPFFYFGAAAAKDPATGMVDPNIVTAVSSTISMDSQAGALFTTLHRGDPMLYFNANATAADTLSILAGVYTKDW